MSMAMQKLTQAVADVDVSNCPTSIAYAINEGVGGDQGCHMQIVMDAQLLTSENVSQWESEMIFDAAKINLLKFGNITRAMQMCKVARDARWALIVGSEEDCGESMDTFLADFAVAVGAGQLCAGGMGSGEFFGKYNRLLEILREDEGLRFSGRRFRS